MHPRFGLKLMLLLVLLCTLLLSWWRLRHDTEQMLTEFSPSVSLPSYPDSGDRFAGHKRAQHAMDVLTELGGEFIYQYQVDAARSRWGAEIGGIEQISRWHKAELRKAEGPPEGAFVGPILLEVWDQHLIDENGLNFVADLPSLRYIRFVDVNLRKKDWMLLQQLKHLRVWQ